VDIQLRILPWAVASLVGAAPVAIAESFSTGVRACFAEQDPPRRLACYDAEVGKMISADRADELGGELLPKRVKEGTEPPKAHELTARVARVTQGPNGRVVVHLENDQIWEQSEDGPDLRIRIGDRVKIDRGMLGSYWLAAHSSVAIKVRRTR
jgi:hypothetical protein